MSQCVLRHCGIPFVNASENWFGCESEDLLQFFANDPDYLFVRRWQNLLVAGSAQKAANQCAVCGCAMRKLIVHKRGRQQMLAFDARPKPEGNIARTF